jgi:hypothetical protein
VPKTERSNELIKCVSEICVQSENFARHTNTRTQTVTYTRTYGAREREEERERDREEWNCVSEKEKDTQKQTHRSTNQIVMMNISRPASQHHHYRSINPTKAS